MYSRLYIMPFLLRVSSNDDGIFKSYAIASVGACAPWYECTTCLRVI